MLISTSTVLLSSTPLERCIWLQEDDGSCLCRVSFNVRQQLPFPLVERGNKCGHKERRTTMKNHMTNECHLRCRKCQNFPLVSTHEQITEAHLECLSYPLNCPNKGGARSLTRSTVPTHQEVCPLQQVECEYKLLCCSPAEERLCTAPEDISAEPLLHGLEGQEVHHQEETAECQLVEEQLKMWRRGQRGRKMHVRWWERSTDSKKCIFTQQKGPFSHVILQGTLSTACFINAILAHLTVRTGLNSGNYCYRFVNSLLGLLYWS